MKKFFFICLSSLTLFACTSYEKYYKLDENYLQRRQTETVRFETNDEMAILSASANVLQDFGFTLDETEVKLGLITAYKDREVTDETTQTAIEALALFGGVSALYDKDQKIYTTLVSTKSKNSKGYNVRVEFARIIWNNFNEARVEKIEDPEIYKEFFDKLSKSLFLEAHSI